MANQWAINAEEALLAALNSCARVTKDLSTIDWPSKEAFGAWVGRLQGQRVSVGNVVALQSLSHLNLDDTFLPFRDFYGASLEGASLEGASLYGVSLMWASLEGASLEGANLERANLERASLERANLEEANFTKADLQSIRWDEHINWFGIIGLEVAMNVPEALKQELDLTQLEEANET